MEKNQTENSAGQRDGSLTDAQRMAVSHGAGPMMVLAGPGSGKTMVITRRVRELIESRGVSPSNILVVTFTRAAARQMEERFTRMMDGRKGRVTFSTPVPGFSGPRGCGRDAPPSRGLFGSIKISSKSEKARKPVPLPI